MREGKRAARDKNKYYTVRGGYLTEFYPKSIPLPEPESLPATDAVLNGTCKSTYPRPWALAAIKNHKDWFAHQELVKAREVHVKNNPSLGDSAVNNREATRLISASTPFAGKAFDVRVDGTYATALSIELRHPPGRAPAEARPLALRLSLIHISEPTRPY